MADAPNYILDLADAPLSKQMLINISSDAEEFESIVREFEGDTGEKINMPITEFQRFILEGRYNTYVRDEFSISTIPFANDIAPVLFQMKWKFLVTSDNEKFVTSDNPVSIYGSGLSRHDADITFPISQDIGFWGTWGNIREGYEDVSNRSVKQFNRRTVISASRYVYSARNADSPWAPAYVSIQASALMWVLSMAWARPAPWFDPPHTHVHAGSCAS